MIPEELREHIEGLITGKKSFAVFRIPGENVIKLIEQTGHEVNCFDSLSALNENEGFVIVPFQITDEYPVLLIKGKVTAYTFDEIPDEEYPKIFPQKEVSLDYRHRFEKFIKPLRDKEFDKLVLSRSSSFDLPGKFSLTDVFLKACKRYIRSYVFLYYTPQTGFWLGSTPEILLSGSGKEWHTVALAGTQPLQQGKIPEIWDEKNRKEQQFVVDYIRTQLANFGIVVEETEAYAIRAGELSHLKSDFRFMLPDNQTLGDLLAVLHPTPAVCGLPKDSAYRFILDNEGYNRRYYSGFIGILNPEEKSDIYVNLRCMQIEEKHLTLYAGGGLLASSVLEDEWMEIEDKMATMQALIV
ncbi:isochorismate synthase [Parabacteroides sp. OttesenSCG-928-G07]|nr:isochorismate synthase [Parabacteroides sp. OttesenSCG-928-G21]MDL2277048.1 isochorismate synthase [Parabacteroides sp. OttesenSCG-928-G07]